MKVDSAKRPGWWWEIAPLSYNRGRVIHTDGMSVDEFY